MRYMRFSLTLSILFLLSKAPIAQLQDSLMRLEHFVQNKNLSKIAPQKMKRIESEFAYLVQKLVPQDRYSLKQFKTQAGKGTPANRKGRITLSENGQGKLSFVKELPGDNAPSGFRGMEPPTGHGSIWRIKGNVSNMLGVHVQILCNQSASIRICGWYWIGIHVWERISRYIKRQENRPSRGTGFTALNPTRSEKNKPHLFQQNQLRLASLQIMQILFC